MSIQPLVANGVPARTEEPLKIWSCINCRRRKVRCDRHDPCAPCIRNKAECVFPVSGRVPRRGGQNSKISKPSTQNQVELLGGLRRLEAMIGDLGSQVEDVAVTSHGVYGIDRSSQPTNGTYVTMSGTRRQTDQPALQTSPNDWTMSGFSASSAGSQSSGLLQTSYESEDVTLDGDGELVVRDRFWTVFCKEVENIFEAVHGHTVIQFDDHNSSSTTSEAQTHNGYYNFLIRNTSILQQPKAELYPLPSQLLFIWQIYGENVDPFIKVLHVLEMTRTICRLRGSYTTLGPSMMALIASVSLAAVMSLSEEAIRQNFNEDKETLITRFRLGTEQALAKANLLEDFDTVDLQALTIYLSLLQHMGEARAAWLLTGTLVRVAVSMGLHRKDSDSAGLSVFKVESRRRLWWQICILDSHAKTSQFCITADSFDTEMPLNLDDANCGLAVSQSPVNLARWTDTTPLLIRSEVWKLSQALRPSTLSKSTPVPNIDDMDQKLTVLQRSQEIIEDNYLKYADTNNPLHCFVTTSTRLFLIKVDLILYTKRFSIEPIKSREARALHNEKIFTSCVSIINYTYTLLNEPTWVGWRWQIRGRELPWQALRIVLKYLLTQSWAPNYEQAWSSTKRTLDSLSSEERTDPRYLQLSYLANKVQRNRWNTINHQEYSAEPTNTNISTFTPLGTDGTLPAAGIHSPLFGDIKDSLNDLDVDIDWQTWDDFMGGLEPSFDLWDMGGL